MRITIEIDGAETTVRITQRGGTEAASPRTAALEAQAAGPAPPVGEAAVMTQIDGMEATSPQAATLGDRDAGPVPTAAEPTTGGVPPLPLAAPGSAPGAPGPGDLSAGAAAGAPLEPPPAVRTEDDTTEGGQ